MLLRVAEDQPVPAERKYWRGSGSLSLLPPLSFGPCPPQHSKFRKKKDFAAIVVAKPKKMLYL